MTASELCFQIALSRIGMEEIKGAKHNEEILDMAADIGHAWIKTDEVAWCATFASWVALKANCEIHPDKKERIRARGFLEVGGTVVRTHEGREARLSDPVPGDFVVLWRKDPEGSYGHVGFFVRENETHVWILGGNQNNEVTVAPFPKSRLLEIRRPEFTTPSTDQSTTA